MALILAEVPSFHHDSEFIAASERPNNITQVSCAYFCHHRERECGAFYWPKSKSFARGRMADFSISVWLPTEVRRLGRFLPAKQEEDQDTGDDHQNAADENESVWHP